jgi:TRAP-type C4-dicarboxylate transport system substrate-binding protein
MNRRGILGAALVGAAGTAARQATAQGAGGRSLDIRIGGGHGPAAIWISTIREHFIPRVTQRVERETPHRIRWTEAWGGAVCRPGDCLEAVESGLLDIGDIQVVFEPSKLMAHNFALYAPFGPSDPRVAAKLARAVYDRVPRLKEILERQFKQVYLAASTTGNYGLVTVNPWRTLSDLRGRKIAAAGANLAWLQAPGVGVVPVQSNLNEAFTSMQTGVYEGWVMFADGVTSFRLHELSKQFVDVGFGCIPIPVLCANRDSWRGIPADVQRIIREEAASWSDHLGEQFHLRTEAAFATMRQAGLTVRSLDDEERRAWAMSLPNLAKQRMEEIRRANQPAEAVSAWIELAKEAGHRWPRDWLAES